MFVSTFVRLIRKNYLSANTVSSAHSSQSVEQRISSGLVALILRQVIVNGVVFIGNIVLSRWLQPELYGIFAAVLAFQQTLLLFSDVGFGPALIQRAEEPKQHEIASLFTLQIILAGIVCIIVWLFAPQIEAMTNLGSMGAYLIRTLAVVLLITAFRSIPAMLLERNLNFHAIALAEMVSQIIYQSVLIGLVWWGAGISSIIWGLAARYISDLLIILYFYRWRPTFSMQIREALPYIWFGLNMQGVRVMAYVKDQLPLLLLVPILGAASAGQWGWTLAYIGIPVYFLRLVDRVMFPAYARVQQDQKELSTLTSTALWLNLVIGLPILLVLVLFAPIIIPLIYGKTWLIALPLVNLLAFNMLGGFVTSAGFTFLYGTGKSLTALKIFCAWVIITLVGSVVGIYTAQLIGIAVAFSIATIFIALLLIYIVQSICRLDIYKTFLTPGFACIISGFIGKLGLMLGIHWLISITLVLGIYAILICLWDRNRIYQLMKPGFVRT